MNVSLLNYTIHTYHSGTRFHCINPRSREGSDCAARSFKCRLMNFNPRSREGSDVLYCYIYRFTSISIHAPARGATMCAKQKRVVINISIHAPARGATLSKLGISVTSEFQSTLPRGEQPKTMNIKRELRNFNPRSREGSDIHGLMISPRECYFNPRSREGSDQSLL